MQKIIKAKKILVRAPNWVGDVVMATPSFRCIRENFEDSHITLLIKKNPPVIPVLIFHICSLILI